jgi:hypothetical protein
MLITILAVLLYIPSIIVITIALIIWYIIKYM